MAVKKRKVTATPEEVTVEQEVTVEEEVTVEPETVEVEEVETVDPEVTEEVTEKVEEEVEEAPAKPATKPAAAKRTPVKKAPTKKAPVKKAEPKPVAKKAPAKPVAKKAEPAPVEVEEEPKTQSKLAPVDKESAVEQLILDVELIAGKEETDFVKANELSLIMKDLLETEGLVVTRAAASRIVSGYSNIIMQLMRDHGKRITLANKQFRKSHTSARVFKAREGFTDLDTLTLPHDVIYLNIPVNRPDSIRGTYDAETDVFTDVDGNTYNIKDLNA